jgi:polyhydroxyalkanoate synthesis regulator phasin
MTKLIDDAYLASLGIAFLTYEKAEKLTQNLIKKGELAKNKQKEFIQDLMDKAKSNGAELEKVVKEKLKYLADKGEPLKDKQDKIIEDITKKAKEGGKITEKKIRDLIKDIIKKGKETAEKQQRIFKDLKNKITKSDEERIAELLRKSNIPSKEEIDEIRKKLDELAHKIG